MLRLAVAALIGLVLAAAPLTARADSETRVALVIGNGAYEYLPRLDNPTNDAQLVATTLKSLGFTLIGGKAQTDLDRAGFENAIREFGAALSSGAVGLFYYAGHGVQVQGDNYLVPVGANPTSTADVDFELIDVQLVLKQMETASSKLIFVILDACRNNPFSGRGLRDSGGGLAQMRAPTGTLISYATQPGNVAMDGTNGHSPYTAALVDALQKPGLGVFDVFNTAAVAVKNSTGGEQQPWVSNSPIEGKFYFLGPKDVTTPTPPDVEIVFWQSISSSNNAADFEEYLRRYPNGQFAALARNRIAAVSPPPPPPQPKADLEVVFWQSISSSNNAADFEEYLRKYPNGQFSGLAGNRLAALRMPTPVRPAQPNPAPSPEPDLSVDDLLNKGGEAELGKDYAAAMRWYRKAADQGNAAAQYDIGVLYSNGQGVAQDYTEAMRWFRKAAAGGNGQAYQAIGLMYFSGLGVPKDSAQARAWLKKAAASGFPYGD